MRSKVFLVVLVVLVSQATVATSHAAVLTHQFEDGSGVGAETSKVVPTGPSTSGSKSASDVTCTYAKSGPDDLQVISRYMTPDNPAANSSPDSGTWYNRTCTDSSGQTVSMGPVWVADRPPSIEVAQQAFDYRSLPVPNIALSPSVTSPQLVNLPTWLSVGADAWKPVAASASVAGVTATTTATPVKVVWSAGDGGSVMCSGPGVPYDISKPAATQHSDCTYLFRRASTNTPGGKFNLTATVTWSVTWTATGVAAGQPTAGTLADVTRTSATQVQVIEAGALNRAS